MPKKNLKCLTCGKAVPEGDNPFSPFCSEKCKLVDLDAWFQDRYSISGEKVNLDEGGGSNGAGE